MKAPKPRKYTRYDPESGRKVSVTADDPRFTDWPERKPSKYAREGYKLADKPVEYVATEAVKTARRKGTTVAKAVLAPIAAGARAALAIPAVQAATAVGLVGAAIYAMQKIGERMDLSDGAKINAISNQFVHTQQETAKHYGGRWEKVPEDVRNKLVAGYKKAISDVTAYRRGTLRPSEAIPYGR